MRTRLLIVATLATLASLGFATWASGADHRDSPTPTGNPGADISDIYVFRSTETPDNVVFVINTTPFIAPSDNATAAFDSNARFQIHIDNDGDLADDVRVDIRKAGNSIIAEGLGNSIGVGVTPAGSSAVVAESGGKKLFAGLRDDPFFFDIPGFQGFLMKRETPVNGLRPAGGGDPADAFGGTNVLAIVLEAPITAVTGGGDSSSGSIGVWVSSTDAAGNRRDRMGIPVFNAALIPPGDMKEAFNQGSPQDDVANFLAAAVGSVGFLRGVGDEVLGGTQDGGPLGDLTPDEVGAALTPDVLHLDFSQATGYPNGRGLADDVIDITFGVAMNRGGAAGVSDGIDANDAAFLASFPYLAEPHGDGGAAGPITPPDTGDAGLLTPAAGWALSAAFLAIALTFGGSAVVATARSRR